MIVRTKDVGQPDPPEGHEHSPTDFINALRFFNADGQAYWLYFLLRNGERIDNHVAYAPQNYQFLEIKPYNPADPVPKQRTLDLLEVSEVTIELG